MIGFLRALAETLAVLLAMAVSFWGWGKLAARIFKVQLSATVSIWTGWAVALLALQVVHLFLPLNAYVSVPMFLVGILLAAPHLPSGLRSYIKENRVAWIAITTAALVLTACWVAARALIPTAFYDAGLYYFNAIRWINTYPIVPGLGNLHGRLGFNQSFFVYAAAVNFYPFLTHANTFSNSFLLLLSLVTLVGGLRPVFYRPSLLVSAHPFLYVPALLALPIVLSTMFASSDEISPSPDLTSKLLRVIMLVVLLRGMAVWEDRSRGETIAVIVLAATAVTIKLSNLVFSAAVIGIGLVLAWRESQKGLKSILRLAWPGAVILVVWAIRGYILTGAPLYPSSIGYLPLRWAVPYRSIGTMSNVIYAWAREPNTNWHIVLSSSAWFRPWILGLWNEHQSDIIHPSISGVVCTLVAVLAILVGRRRNPESQPWIWVILLPAVAGMIYWFFTAPSPRFASGLFLLFADCAALVLISYVQPLVGRRAYLVTLVALFITCNFYLLPSSLPNPAIIGSVKTAGWVPEKTVPLIEKRTASGFAVYMPASGNACWNSPIPCTPVLAPNLHELVPGDPGAGFYIPRP